MAYVINPNAILQVNVIYKLGTQLDKAMTTHHYKLTGASVPDGAAEAFAAAQNFKVAASLPVQKWKATASPQTSVVDVSAQWIYPIRYRAQYAGLAPVVGTFGTGIGPPGTQVSVQRRGEEANRHALGGIRFPATALETAEDGNGLISALAAPGWAAVRDACKVTWSTALNPGATYVPIIFNRLSPASSVLVTDTILFTELRTMRRRVVGRGS